jgi:hypothetical protein
VSVSFQNGQAEPGIVHKLSLSQVAYTNAGLPPSFRMRKSSYLDIVRGRASDYIYNMSMALPFEGNG